MKKEYEKKVNAKTEKYYKCDNQINSQCKINKLKKDIVFFLVFMSFRKYI